MTRWFRLETQYLGEIEISMLKKSLICLELWIFNPPMTKNTHACKYSGGGTYSQPAPMVLLSFLRQVLHIKEHLTAQAHPRKYWTVFALKGRKIQNVYHFMSTLRICLQSRHIPEGLCSHEVLQDADSCLVEKLTQSLILSFFALMRLVKN